MPDRDETQLLPRVRSPIHDVAVAPRPDRWEESETGGGERDSALAMLSWVLPTALAAVLVMIRVSWPNLSSSELSVWSVSRLPWSAARQLSADIDAANIPYQVLMWGWTRLLGHSDLILRLPSVAFMVVAVGLTAALAARLTQPRLGLLAGLVMATLPSVSRYAQEAGPPAFTVLGSALSTYLLVQVFERPGRWRLVGYWATVVILGLSSPIALVVLVAHGVLVGYMRPRALVGWLVAAVFGAAPGAAVLFLGHHAEAGRSAADRFPSDRIPAVVFGTLLVAGIVIGLAVLAVSMKKPAVVATLWAVAPLILLYGLSQFISLNLPETALVTVPAWACLAATALARGPVVRGIAVTIVIGVIGLGAHADLRRPDGHGLAGRAFANTLVANAQPGDAVVYGPVELDGVVGRDLMARYVPADKRPKDILLVRAPRVDGRLVPEECAEVQQCVTGTPRIWLIRTGTPVSPLDNLPAKKDALLRVSYAAEHTWSFTGLTVILYVPKAGKG